jgi:hypothetical protein
MMPISAKIPISERNRFNMAGRNTLELLGWEANSLNVMNAA